ncbi:CotH kinase family protein [Nocardiopsis composta]|uniref:Spore coat protein CotH n=1 Tax=Nocardiopsis composta TaxID=157465 RepID=A0A7W8QM20_9ACTN|nr:CotH kinase family protein [Nocardiopsis composta]MBB5432270.1 spore coat protein CotH [Nocardiopsis composta]
MGTAHRTPSDRPGPPRPRRRLRHRLPVRLRQHWKPAAAAAAALLALVLLLGDARIRPYITSELASEEQITDDIAGTADLFDSSVAHGIEISFDEAAYTDMIRTFQEEGEKEYIKADVVIDGTLIEDAGLRLKGNSTLQSLRGGGTGAAPEDAAGQDGDTAQEDAGQEQGAAPGGGPGGGPGGITLSEDEPESLPWLVSFDEFVEGRAYQGRTEIALRPGTATSEAALNEALALEVTAATGQTTQEYAFSAVTVNGGTEATRLVLESPDPAYADELGEGVLYKGRANGSFAYLGEDPTDYEDAFKQINDEGEADLQPVIDLLRFVDEADDEEFAEELEDRLDTESFALYLATQDLIANNDAMDGPGNNYYLWYDRDAERFTVLSWDLNLAFGGMGGPGGMGGGPGAEQQGAPAEQETGTEQGEQSEQGDGGQGATAGQPPQPPAGDAPGALAGAGTGDTGGDGDTAPEGGVPENPGGAENPGGRGSGALKERFLADSGFRQLYEDAYADLYEQVYADGTASDLLEDITAGAEAAGATDTTEAAESIQESIATMTDQGPEAAAEQSGEAGDSGQGTGEAQEPGTDQAPSS